jgi:hypothetical protein
MTAETRPEEYPAYLDALEVGDEHQLRGRIEALQAELRSLTAALEDARRGKRMLYLMGADLEREVVHFVERELRLEARPADGEGSGFWIPDDQGSQWCIGEAVGSAQGNVAKEHLAHLLVRRMKVGLDESAPALLVVNTYQRGRTMEDRDMAVPPDVARRASEDHMVVMRTIDLLRLQQRAANGFPASEQVTEALRGKGGWLEVDASLNTRLHGAGEVYAFAAPASR